MKVSLLIFFFITLSNMGFAQAVSIYSKPPVNFGKVSDKYLVTITQGNVTKQSFVYESTAGSGPSTEWGTEENNNFHFAIFSFSGTIMMNITKLNSSAASATVRPNRLAIGTLNTITQGVNKTVSFKLSKPAKLSVEFNDDPTYRDVLMIFADTLENKTDVPNINDPSVFLVTNANSLNGIPAGKTVVYFQPGGYSIGHWIIPNSISQIYIAGGAYIIGYMAYVNWGRTGSLKINGRGIISDEGYTFHYPSTPADQVAGHWYNPINLAGGQRNIIEGVTLIEATAFNIVLNGGNTLVKNVNINGFRYNNDGITIYGSGYQVVNCFLRINDDSIVQYASNTTVNNCVFWHLNAGTIFELGWTPHSMANINITNCDILHDQASYTNSNVGFINAMNYTQATQTAAINNITVSNIYFDTPILRFLDIRGDRGKVWTGDPAANQLNWVYRNFKFNNIYFNQSAKNQYPLIYLHGYDNNHPLVNYTFQNIYLNNVKVTSTIMNDSTFCSRKGVYGVTVK